MTAFYLTATAMVALSLLFVLPGLLKPGGPDSTVQRGTLNLDVLRDQLRELDADLRTGAIEQAGYDSARRELEQRVAQDVQGHAAGKPAGATQRWPALAVALAIPALAGSLYWALGTPKALDPDSRAPLAQAPSTEQPAGLDTAAVGPAQIEAMVARLAERLKAQPDDAKGWRMLARSYETLRRFDQAEQAYQRLLQLAPNDAEALVDYAVTKAMGSGQSLSGEPERLLNRALAIDPSNVQALALVGSAAFERRDYAQAIKPWQQILALAPPDSDIARSITSSIAKAQTLAAGASAGKP
jgi:cytochrome c-type biogenesis protein CcmH